LATIRFALKRLAAQRLLALALIVTLAFSIGVLVAGPIYADASREAILSSELHESGPTVKNIRLVKSSFIGPFDYRQADRDAERSLATIPLSSLVRQGLSGNTEFRTAERSVSVPMLFRTGYQDHLLIRGKPAQALDEVVLFSFTARDLGVGIGDTVTATGGSGKAVPLLVTGLYPKAPPQSDFWYGGQSPFPPPDSEAPYPVLMSQQTFLSLVQRLGSTPQYVWDAFVDYDNVSFDQFRQIATQAGNLSFPEGSPLAGTVPSTGLPTLLDLVEKRTANLRVPVYLVVFQIGAVALAVLAGVASLALSRQSFELAVLRSRGFTKRKLIGAQVVQTVATAAVGYPLGLLIGLGLAKLATNSNGPPPPGTRYPLELSSTALTAGALGAIAGAVILVLLSLPVISRTVIEERRALSREARPLLARVPVELFVLPLGIAAFYEVKTRGFLPLAQSGSLDPLVVLAPTLLLFAASFFVLRLLLYGLRGLEGPLGGTKSLPVYLAGRRLGRSPGTSFAISLLLVLAIGLLVVSSSYRATVIRNHEDSAHQAIGADWQLQVAPPDHPLQAIGRLPERSTPVLRTSPSLEGTFSLPPTTLAIDPDTYPSGGWWRSDYASESLDKLMGDLGNVATGLRLPPGTTGLTLCYNTATRGIAGLDLGAVLSKPGADSTTSIFGPIGKGSGSVSVSTNGATELLSLFISRPSVGNLPHVIRIRLDLDAEGANPGPVDLGGFQGMAWRGSAARIQSSDSGATVTITPGAGTVVGGIIPPEQPLPVLATAGIAPSGGTFQATLGGERLQFQVVDRIRGFPTTIGDSMVAPIGPLLTRIERVGERSLSVSEVWAMGDQSPRAAVGRAGFIPGDQQNAQEIVALLSQLPQSLAVGMNFTAAAGGMGLVIIGVSVGLYFTQRRREFEFASLRAMGSKRRQLSAVLLTEQGAMIAFAVAAGGALGYAIVRLMMPYLGKSIGSAFPLPVLVLDWRWLGIYGVAVLAATAVGLILALQALVRSSVTSVLRGEAE